MRPVLIKLILYLCAYLPLPVIHAIGVCIGWCLIFIPNRSRQTSEINIALCWPELSAREQRTLLRNSLKETGKTIIETSALWLRPGENALRLIRRVDGNELVEQALAQGSGAILATPHLGAWEAAGLYGSAQFKITCLYRPLKMQELENLVHNRTQSARWQLRTGNSQRNPRISIKTWIRVVWSPCYRTRSHRLAPVFSHLFSEYLPTVWCFWHVWPQGQIHQSSSPGANGCPGGAVITCTSERLPERVHSDNIHTAVTAINQAVEDCVRECPEQYQWSYRRFKTRPDSEPSFYKKKRTARRNRLIASVARMHA